MARKSRKKLNGAVPGNGTTGKVGKAVLFRAGLYARLAYADYPENADELFSFIEIDADENVIRIDEDMKEERQYHEYPLNLLLEKARKVVGINPYSGYESLNRDRLYREMRQAVTGGIGRETGQEMGRRGRTKERDAAQEQVMQDGSGQDGNDMPMVQRM